MTRGATVSAALHVFVLLALVLVIPHPLPPPPPADDTMEVEFEGTAASAQKSQDHGKVAAAAEADTPADENPALVAPKPQPLEHAPPPPPPPPPPAQAAPSPQTVMLKSERIPLPPPEKDAIALKPPPPLRVVATPPPPQIVETKTPVTKPVLNPTKAKPLDSVRHQQNQTRNPAVDTHSLDNTLEKFLADQKQTVAPTHTYNPSRGGARNAGGQVHGNLTGDLTQGQRKQIGDSVKPCYSEDTAAKDYASYYADMEVTIDAAGEVHDVKLMPAFAAKANADPAYRAFAERAEHAVMDPHCAHLPIPADKLGKPSQTLSFRFRP